MALLYAEWQTQGVRVEPWVPGVMVRAAADRGCLHLAVASGLAWRGRLLFDAPRHRLHLGRPLNYPA